VLDDDGVNHMWAGGVVDLTQEAPFGFVSQMWLPTNTMP
jgi:hypothetical protein